MNIVRAATVLAVSLLVLDYILVAPQRLRRVLLRQDHHRALLVPADRVPGRLARRLPPFPLYAHAAARARGEHSLPTLVLGRAADAEVLLRAIESGAVSSVRPVGILSPSRADRGQSIRGIPVLGESRRSRTDRRATSRRAARTSCALIFTPSALAPEAAPEVDPDARAPARAARPAGCRRSTTAAKPLQLAPVAVEDLLLRPSVKIDYRRLESFVHGQVDRRHRRRRLDRRGNLRPRGRRSAPRGCW